MFEEIKRRNELVRDQIYKGFVGGEELLEKAHNEGDVHPNGKWVWTKLPSGKYDWRTRKDGSAKKSVEDKKPAEKKPASAPASKQDGDEEANKIKKWYIRKLKSEGANSNDSRFMSKNQEHFKDVLKKYGFDSFEDFEDWGSDHSDNDKDIEKYDKIFFQCVNKIPASEMARLVKK